MTVDAGKLDRAVEQLVAGARAKTFDTGHCVAATGFDFRTPFRVQACGWSLLLGIHRHDGVEHWHFSALLWPQGRSSTEDDWIRIGRVAGALAAASGHPPDVQVDPLTPVETTPVNAVHHWVWHSDGSPLDPAAMRAFETVLASLAASGGPSAEATQAFPAIDLLLGLLERVLDAEGYLGAVPMGGAHVDENLSQGVRALGAAAAYATKHGHDDVAESLADLLPLFERDVERACGLLRELRISVRLQLDNATDAAGLPRVAPASIRARTPFRRTRPKVGRNQPCPCGSGKKHKKCCGRPG